MNEHPQQTKADWEDARNAWQNSISQTVNKNPNYGGTRKGAGRPAGSGSGRTVTTSSINLPPAVWAKLDALRGDQTRSAWIAAKIRNSR